MDMKPLVTFQEDFKRKQVVVLSARVHPGETPSSWINRGLLNFLTGESEVAADLRDRFIFKVRLRRHLYRGKLLVSSS
jgi:hypothetical protein